jgi:hypothetical protein
MGTRSLTIVMDGNDELVRIYRQMDGYPEDHGVDLARLCDLQIVNGLGVDPKKVANGMGCLAAQIIAGLKDGPGGIYLEKCGGEINDWCEYVYIVRGVEGHQPVIDCSTQPGPWPFNIQKDEHFVFAGTGKAWLKKYAKKASVA